MKIKYTYLLRLILILLVFIATSGLMFSQSNTFRVFFRDKGIIDFSAESEVYKVTYNSLSERAIKRRLKVLPENNVISIEDVPLNQKYLDEITGLGAKIIAKVKWMNYCVVAIDDVDIIDDIAALSYVSLIQATSSEFNTLKFNDEYIAGSKQSTKLLNRISIEQADSNNVFYGASYEFADMIRVPEVHSMGISGIGVLIGFLDSGFRPRAISALQNLDLLAEYDFVYRDSITSNQQFDHPKQDNHGTQVLSIAVGNKPEKYIGISPNSSVALGKTESLHYERKIEEDWFFEGVEWLESLGVDIISASLGYLKFDSLQTSYQFSNLTGNKAITSQSVNLAAKRGILFVVAAGNNGPSSESINTPADADSVVSVGSVNADRLVSNFSSRGGDALGRIRPHISARGALIQAVNPDDDGTFVTGGGTSFSTPMISGAAALILSAFPELKPYELKQILYKSADNYPEQNNETGYGIPDIYSALINHDIVISEMATYPTHIFQRVVFKITYKFPISMAILTIKENSNSEGINYTMNYVGNNYFYADISKSSLTKDTMLAQLLVIAENGKTRRKPFYEGQYFKLIKNNEKFAFGVSLAESAIQYIDNPKSFVYPSVASRGNGFVKLVTYSEKNSSIRITVSDLMGKIYYEVQNLNNYGLIEMPIPISDCSSGVYFVQIHTKDRTEVIKLIIF